MKLPFAAAALALAAAAAVNVPVPPVTRRQPVTDTLHGMKITDPYRWLEDQKSPQTRAWIKEQQQYTKTVLQQIPGREDLRRRIESLLRVETETAPLARGGRYFYLKREPDQNQAVLYMREGRDGREQVLVDPNPLSPDHNTSVRLMNVSRDGTLLAYGLRHGGEDEVEVHFMDPASRRQLPDVLPRARIEALAITPSLKTVYYAVESPAGPRLRMHSFGTESQSDPVIFGEQYAAQDILDANVTESGRYLVITVAHGSAADNEELHYKDLTADSAIKPIVTGVMARFEPTLAGDTLFVNTTLDAPKGRVVRVDLARPDRANWKPVVGESQWPLFSISAIGDLLALNYTDNVSTRIRLVRENGQRAGDVRLPGLGTVDEINGRWGDDEAFYAFTSFVQRPVVFRFVVSTRKQTVWFNPRGSTAMADVETTQVWYRSHGGTQIPMFLVSPSGAKQDGNQPVLLTGYGGFLISLTPTYSPVAAAWLSLGGTYAVANLRGGGEFGEAWHRAGMLENKQNVFDDFYAAMKYLTAQKYTNPARLAIMGASNGGLLVGAAVTQQPRLFHTAVCEFPLLDMLRYDKFGIAKFWVPEYGSAENAQQFRWLYTYSPYQHVQQNVAYPAVMFVSGDADTRVDPLHARKMTALMQQATRDPSERRAPVLLEYDTEAGHSAGLSVAKAAAVDTDILSFIAWQLGVRL